MERVAVLMRFRLQITIYGLGARSGRKPRRAHSDGWAMTQLTAARTAAVPTVLKAAGRGSQA
jgi:hypothetical protein